MWSFARIYLIITFVSLNIKGDQMMLPDVLLCILHHTTVTSPKSALTPCFVPNNHTGDRAKLPSSRWRWRDRSLWEVFACLCFFVTTDLSNLQQRNLMPANGHICPGKAQRASNAKMFPFDDVIMSPFSSLSITLHSRVQWQLEVLKWIRFLDIIWKSLLLSNFVCNLFHGQ